MTIRGWKTQFKEIRKEFGYLEKEYLVSVRKLDALLKGKKSKRQFQNMIQGKTVFIIGAGPSLTKSLKYIKKSNLKELQKQSKLFKIYLTFQSLLILVEHRLQKMHLN